MAQSAIEQVRSMAMLLLKPYEAPTSPNIADAVRVASGAVQGMGSADIAELDQVALVKEIEALLDVWMPEGKELLDETGHLAWLPDKRSQIQWQFWRRYEQYLEQEKRLPQLIVSRLNSLTDRVLENLEDPARRGAWDRRGMVVGQVQSGKTSNYTGLICKAVDAGYKLIIVLAGTHNSLRSQTQLRLDEGFLGRDTKQSRVFTKESAKMGVGYIVGAGDLPAHSLTTSAETGDFKKSQANNVATYIGGDPVILVIKKNGSVLKNLIQWVQTTRGQKDSEGRHKIKNLPMLLLDDEADNASVHTRDLEKDEEGKFKDVQNLTAINRLIRTMLHMFEQSAYVGYTATPFANIFIHPHSVTRAEGEDLFPRSFIINLPAPSNYIGPARVFGLDAVADLEPKPGLPIVRVVADAESLIPSSHRQDLIPAALPGSLRQAIRAFILSCAARLTRGQVRTHNSMLVHVTRFVAVQKVVADLIVEELRQLKNRLEYGDGDRTPRLLDELQELWESDFAVSMPAVGNILDDPLLTPLAWEEVKQRLKEAALKIDVKVINGSAGDVLDYFDHPNGISTIAIGGDKLSRGLTLEGLSVSYYLRASRMYDTLMQMGRWFGYRPGYADLCRLYTTQELVDWYEHVTIASEELRQEFERMADARMTPSDYGLKVQTHPGGLTVTSAGKMRYGRKVRVSFDNQLVESHLIQKDKWVIQRNFEATDGFVKELQQRSPLPQGADDYVWKGVSGDDVVAFLERMTGHAGLPTVAPDKLAEYISKKMLHSELETWTVVLDNKAGKGRAATLGGIADVGLTLRTPPEGTLQSDTYKIRNRHIISMGDEMVDLTDAEEALARSAAAEDAVHKQQSPPKYPGGRFIRAARSPARGLLLLYALDPEADGLFLPGDDRRAGVPILGFAISFPGTSRPGETVEYIVNTVYLDEEAEFASES